MLSPTVRNIWKDNHVERDLGQFRQWSAEIARSENIPYVDLTTIVANKYEEMGKEKVKELFATDHTHTSPAGAELNAASVVAGIKGLKDCPLAGYLSEKGKTVNAYVANAVQAQASKTSFKFDFGPGKVAPGYVQVLPSMIYNKEL